MFFGESEMRKGFNTLMQIVTIKEVDRFSEFYTKVTNFKV